MTANKPADLKACAHCGGVAAFEEIGDRSHPDCGAHFIFCTNGLCGASTNLRFACGDDPRPLLAEQWNRRAPADREPVAWVRRNGDLPMPKLEWNPKYDVWGGPRDGYGNLADISLYAFPPAEPEMVRELEGLAEKWRDYWGNDDDDRSQRTLRQCAAELESLLKGTTMDRNELLAIADELVEAIKTGNATASHMKLNRWQAWLRALAAHPAEVSDATKQPVAWSDQSLDKRADMLGVNVSDAMVNRFLSWNLPLSVFVDPCAMTRDYPNRTGTNLLTADEARQMLEHVLAESPPAEPEMVRELEVWLHKYRDLYNGTAVNEIAELLKRHNHGQ